MNFISEEYVARIANASGLQLVIINYEIVIDYLRISKQYIEDNGKYKLFEFNICKARDFLGQLRASLNMTYEISYNLMSLYNYVDRLLAFALFNKKTDNIDEAIGIMQKLLASWVQIQDFEEDKTPSIENAQQIFSGITYNKNGFLDEYVQESNERGFKA